MQELGQEKLSPLFKLKYNNAIADAVAELGRPEEIGRIEQLSDLSAPVGHIVPTSVTNLDGRFFVGNLGLFPVEVGSSKL